MADIRLVRDVPVDPAHGLTQGRVLTGSWGTTSPCGTREASRAGWWVVGDQGEPVLVLEHEAEEVAQLQQVAG